MPDIRQLKAAVEAQDYKAPLLIMEYADDSFLADTYWRKLLQGRDFRYASMQEVLASTVSLFGAEDTSWKVCRNPDQLSVQLTLATNTIIVCPLIKEQSLRDSLGEWIYTMPKV